MDATGWRTMPSRARRARATSGIVNAAWRHTFAAHKLIATPKDEMAFLSKENDSNGCIGTVDVSYPSIPLFLQYCPELVNALCRPGAGICLNAGVGLRIFAPHDVGRYPLATGQVYAARRHRRSARACYPPYYLYPAGTDVCGRPRTRCRWKSAAICSSCWRPPAPLARTPHWPSSTARCWTTGSSILVQYGEDPAEQLCTDDFAGHLAHNVNLAAKAIVGVACYARLTGDESSARAPGQDDGRPSCLKKSAIRATPR